jgi:hypothetical protein
LWEPPPVINEFLCLEKCFYFIKINFHVFIILRVNLYFYHSHFIISCNWRSFLYWKPIPTFVRILSRISELDCNYLHFVWRQWLSAVWTHSSTVETRPFLQRYYFCKRHYGTAY